VWDALRIGKYNPSVTERIDVEKDSESRKAETEFYNLQY
jgi:hypothetical protein